MNEYKKMVIDIVLNKDEPCTHMQGKNPSIVWGLDSNPPAPKATVQCPLCGQRFPEAEKILQERWTCKTYLDGEKK